MFATLVFERDPLTWSDLPGVFLYWLQGAGGLATVLLAIWWLANFLSRSPADRAHPPYPWNSGLFKMAFVAALLLYLGGFAIRMSASDSPALPDQATQASVDTSGLQTIATYCFTVGGALAVAAVLIPVLLDVPRLRFRRIWALARLSFKEAVRHKVLWAFSMIVLVFLFGSWFIDYKAENQVRNYVQVIYWAMTPLTLLTAALLTSFSLPADIKNQTIHTIVTKPVERFEIVLGRFLGYTLLMTFVMLIMTGVSLLYMLREINEEAKFESLCARVPIYGNLTYRGTERPEGDSVGREWGYRGFIAGGATSRQRAVWGFQQLPSNLASRTADVICEFNFDVFRTHKGEEGKGVFCTLVFQTWHWDESKIDEFQQERVRERAKAKGSSDAALVDARLAEKYGYYEIKAKQIFDYHTQFVQVPLGLFKNALEDADKRPAETSSGRSGTKAPLMQVLVKCESPAQYVGMAKHDLYLLDAESWFALNFFKGALGLWLRLCIIIGLAVTLSTYLSGVISFLATMFLFAGGFIRDGFVRELAEGKSLGGGPMESLFRLLNKSQLMTELDPTPGAQLAVNSDYGFRLLFSALRFLLPETVRFDFTDYVAEGFNIGGGQLLLSLILLAGYLGPCALIAYYLLKSREVAA